MGIRKEKTLPVLDECFKWIISFDPNHIIKGKFRDGIVYSQNQEEALRAFLFDGRLLWSRERIPCSVKLHLELKQQQRYSDWSRPHKRTGWIHWNILSIFSKSCHRTKAITWGSWCNGQKPQLISAKLQPANNQTKRRTGVIASIYIMIIVDY